MKKTFALLMLIMLTALHFSALADHSVLPAEGDMDETQALDRAIGYLCAEKRLDEEEVRGYWFFDTCYYEESFYYDADADTFKSDDGSVWKVDLIDSVPSGFSEEDTYAWVDENGDQFGYRGETMLYQTLACYSLAIGARDGSILRVWEWEYDVPIQPEEFHLIRIPKKSQLQPQEALDRAYGLLAQALALPEDEVRAQFRDYYLSASSALDTSRCWYHAELNADHNMAADHGYHVYLDMDSGETIFHTNDVIIAGRYDLWQQGVNHGDWYREQLKLREDAWGPMDGWDYLRYAAFERGYFGRPFNHLTFSWGLPGVGDCTLQEAKIAAREYLSECYGGSQTDWSLTSSCFWTDYSGDFETHLALFDTEPQRMWQLFFRSSDGKEEEIVIDPASCEIVNGGVG